MPPTLGTALALGLRALSRETSLLAGGVTVAFARRLLLWPAAAAAWALLFAAAAHAARAHPLDPLAALDAVAAAATSPRFLATVGGLWLAGLLLGAALRVAWLSGALPTLAGALASGDGAPPRFAVGVAFGYPRVVAAAALAFVAEASGGLFAAALGLGAAQVSARAFDAGGSLLLAAAVALGLTLAVAVPVTISVVGDVAVARAAIRQDGPAEAFAGATRRFLKTPGTFVLAALVFAVAGLAGPAAVTVFGNALTVLAPEGPALVRAGPAAVLALASLVVTAAIDLVWLGTVAALACVRSPGD